MQHESERTVSAQGVPIARRVSAAVLAVASCLAMVVMSPATATEEIANEDPSTDFAAWVAGLRAEALGRKISPATLDAALDGMQPIDRVIELDRKQPESTLTLSGYMELVISDARVATGKKKLREHADLLRRISDRYGVQPRFLVALWGIESDFGRRTGGFEVIDALATLAWDGRRGSFFRGELFDALAILEQGHISASKMTGSWAGAMGQPQFMPSSFLRYAVDFDGDSRRDIWNTLDDVLGSAANYLSSSGWKSDQTWGRRVRLPGDFDSSLVGRKVTRTMDQWRALGVRRADGSDLPRRNLKGSIIRPGGEDGPAYLVYDNYRTILRWNRSDYFGVAVGTLSDRISRP